MKKFIALALIIVSVAGCASAKYRDYKDPVDILGEIDREMASIVVISTSDEFMTKLLVCDVKNKKKQAKCISDFEDVMSAKIRLNYPELDKAAVNDRYIARRDDHVASEQNRMVAAGHPHAASKKTLNECAIRMQYYENLASRSHRQSLASARQEEDWNQVDAYNDRLYARKLANTQAWSNLSQSLGSMSQQMQLNRIEDNQKQMEWQHKVDKYERDGGIMPTR